MTILNGTTLILHVIGPGDWCTDRMGRWQTRRIPNPPVNVGVFLAAYMVSGSNRMRDLPSPMSEHSWLGFARRSL